MCVCTQLLLVYFTHNKMLHLKWEEKKTSLNLDAVEWLLICYGQ